MAPGTEVRKRVSFTVPAPTSESSDSEHDGVHAPLNVVIEDEKDILETPASDSENESESDDNSADKGVPKMTERCDAVDSASTDQDGASDDDEMSSSKDSTDNSDSSDLEDQEEKEANDSPSNAPPSVTTFGEMQLDKRVSWAIAKLGWRCPTPVQACAVPAALAGRDVLVAAPTGSGKTAAYAVPLANQICVAQAARGHAHADGTVAVVLVPTRELATQVASHIRTLLRYVHGVHVATLTSTGNISLSANKKRKRALESSVSATAEKDDGTANAASNVGTAPTTAFARTAEVLVGTPAAVVALHKQHGEDALKTVSFVVVDEADLVLSYGHGADARTALAAVPSTAQAMLVSATLDADGLPELRKVVLRQPLTVKVTATPGADPSAAGGDLTGPGAAHYFARLNLALDRYLVTYAMLRLNVITGKVLIFANGINSAFRLKLFLDQFKVKSAVLNSELPANSRVHCVEQFNAGIFDILIATDEIQRDDSNGSKAKRPPHDQSRAGIAIKIDDDDKIYQDSGNESGDGSKRRHKRKMRIEGKKGGRKANIDTEFGVARGVDFRGVAAVINFDSPETSVSYTHRAGRTARAGASGTVLSLVITDAEQAGIIAMGQASGQLVGPLAFRMDQIEAFRYRVEDSLRAVTDSAVHDARLTDVRREMMNSDRLKDYFEDNPLDYDALKHDLALAKHIPEHLSRVPAYLLPPALRSSAVNARQLGGRPRSRNRNHSGGVHSSHKKGDDPLKTFTARRSAAGGNSRDRYKSKHGVSKTSTVGKGGGANKNRNPYS
jgi:ATP-dependent RNA helicase DDX56/DBP9